MNPLYAVKKDEVVGTGVMKNMEEMLYEQNTHTLV